MPTATGGLGEKPAITFPGAAPVPSLQRVILSAGTGPVTRSKDWLITNYLEQVWAGAVFDNSFDEQATFQIDVGAVVPGWDVALDRTYVILVLPKCLLTWGYVEGDAAAFCLQRGDRRGESAAPVVI